MKHLSFILEDSPQYEKAKKQAAKKKYTSRLLQLYTSLLEPKELKRILKKLHKDFPDTLIVGTTTAGEISHAKMYQGKSVVSLSLFKKSTLRATYLPRTDFESALTAAKEVCRKDTRAAVVLSEGLNGEDYEGFIKGLHSAKSDMLIAGGLAGDGFRLQRTYILFGTRVYDRGSIVVTFSGKKLYADNRYNLNWYAVGKEFTITRARGNAIIEIDGINAVELFTKYLGEKIFENDAASLPDFQLLYKEGSTVVSRTPMSREKDAILFAAPIKEGQRVRFGFSNAASVISGANATCDELCNRPAQAIYIFSCIARKILLGEVLENEFKAFESIAPTAGFFTYGEFYSTDTNNALLNCTTTVLILSEKSTAQKKRSAKRSKSLHRANEGLTFKAMTNFIEQTSLELDSNIKLLQQYREIVDKSFLVSKMDTKGRITYVNEAFCAISGYTHDELIGKDFNSLRSRHTQPAVIQELLAQIQKGSIWRGQLSEESKEGSTYYLDTTIMPIFDEKLNIQEYISVSRDITQRLLAQKKLEEKERFIQAILDNQDSIVVYTSSKKRMITVNKKFFEYFEFKSYEDFIAKHNCICELFLDEEGYVNSHDMPQWLEQIAADPANDYKAKLRTRNGSVHTFSIKIKKIHDEFIINLYDITNLEEAIKQAHLSERAKSIFLANMSHEIRTPLNGIIGFTELLAKEKLPPKQSKYIQIIQKSSQMLLGIVNDILDFSKIESGELTLNPAVCNVKEELEAAAMTFVSLAKSKAIEYHIEIDPDIPQSLLCDMQRIKQVISNLISNAIKFTPQQGRVVFSTQLIKLHTDKAELLFKVSDTGIGIPKEKQNSIFKPFLQADDSISKHYGGTGLGLSISSQFIELMDSHIELTSTEGKGSTFCFTLMLPIAKKPSQSGHLLQPSFRHEGAKHRVLIVEDNATNVLLVSILLDERGIAYDVAYDGKEALLKIASAHYDLVLMDVNMPVMDGLSAIKELRSHGYDLPVVTLSANVIQKDVERFKEAGANDTLAKPITPQELDKILKHYLKEPLFTQEGHKRMREDRLSILKEHLSFLDESTIKKLLHSFLETLQSIEERLAHEGLDYKGSHTLKGLAANFRFEHLEELAREAEQTLQNETTKALPQHLTEEIRTEIQKVKKELQALLE